METPGTNRDVTPESAAVTGGVPAAAEPAPQVRDRRSSRHGFIWLSLIVGVLLLFGAAFADVDADQRTGTIIAGVGLIAITLAVITGLLPLTAAALMGFFVGALLTIAAFSASDFGVIEGLLLIAGAVLFIAPLASLASSRRMSASGTDAEERPGVENV